ncbi:MAG: GspE/PulE family protein [Clostridium sp.]|uniref:GspE/PulE family protein n=1 Tax=Clostridium sp. TaxID=1506 RepID=UPI003F3F7285
MKKRLGDLLVELGYISEKDVEEAIKYQKETGKRLGEIFVARNLIEEDTLLKILEVQLGISRAYLENIEFDVEAVFSISESLAKKYDVIPIKFEGEKLVLAMADPLNIFAEEDVSISTGYKLDIRIAPKREIREAISKYYSKKYMEDAALKMESKEKEKIFEESLEKEEKSPAIKLIDTIIENAVRNKASDIHIEPQKNKIIIRYRIDGRLKKQFEAPKEPFNSMITRIKLLGGMDIAEKRVPQDGKIVINIDNREIDLRVSILPSINGENIVIRILDKKAFDLNINNLGLREDELKKVKRIVNNPYGMVLVTGPTGSGKTSTLYSILSDMDIEEKNIITIEDPVEYTLDGLVQVNVNKKANLSFEAGLKAILRQSPDVIMVGELRESDAAIMAIRAAITGHLVLSTLHTNDSIGVIVRLMDMGISEYLIGASLGGVISQRLVRNLCDECKSSHNITEAERKILKASDFEDIKIYEPKGCLKCNGTGYRGRSALFEILEIDEEIKELINLKKDSNTIFNNAKEKGFKTLFQSGCRLVKEGKTSLSEVLSATLIKG